MCKVSWDGNSVHRDVASTIALRSLEAHDVSSHLQAQQRRISQLELQLRETRARLDESDSIQTEALQRHAEMQQELENNAGE